MSELEKQAPRMYLFRHGETDWSKTGQHTGRTDIQLTENGRTQASALHGVTSRTSFSNIYVSPLKRAQETALLAGFDLSAIQTQDDLAEMDYGEYEGLTTSEIREKVPGWSIWTHTCPGGETLRDVQVRCQRLLNGIMKGHGNIALVSHGHLLRILTATYLQLPPEDGRHLMLDTSTVSILSHERENRAIQLWNMPASFV
jgi:probable phosphoglycerate mutase